jgi:drug/metabolite transporter (DMT)-like permease
MTILLSITIILLTATGQIFLKKGALSHKSIFINYYVWTGYSIFLVVMGFSTLLMYSMPLKYFSAIMGINYPATVLLAGLILKEKINSNMLLASLVVAIGYIVFNL